VALPLASVTVLVALSVVTRIKRSCKYGCSATGVVPVSRAIHGDGAPADSQPARLAADTKAQDVESEHGNRGGYELKSPELVARIVPTAPPTAAGAEIVKPMLATAAVRYAGGGVGPVALV
jgi:hypothetical protein